MILCGLNKCPEELLNGMQSLIATFYEYQKPGSAFICGLTDNRRYPCIAFKYREFSIKVVFIRGKNITKRFMVIINDEKVGYYSDKNQQVFKAIERYIDLHQTVEQGQLTFDDINN